MSTERGADDAGPADRPELPDPAEPPDHAEPRGPADGDVGGVAHQGEELTDYAREGGRTRRPPRSSRLPVAVALAVLLASGGGGYWASTAGDSGGRADRGRPAPLLVDGVDQRGQAPGGGTSATVGSITYRLTGSLPKGPASAPVYRAGGTVDTAAVQRLAELLGVSGPVTADNGAWRVGPASGSGPGLLVGRDAPGLWTYSRSGSGPVAAGVDASGPVAGSSAGSASAGPATVLGSGPIPRPAETAAPADSGSPPVSAERAEAVAAPVFQRLGLSRARIDAAQTVGAQRMVTADPVVGGLPTHGWSTTLQVGPDGRLVTASGQLSALAEGPSYPVVSARAAFEQLNVASPEHPDRGVPLSCSVPMPLPMPQSTPTLPGQDKTLPHSLPCVPGNGRPTEVRGAVFGLSTEFVQGARTLVPSWLFETAPAGVARTTVVAQSAVDPAYVRGPGGPPGTNAPGGPSPVSPGIPGVPGTPGVPIDPGSPIRSVDPTPPAGPGKPPVPALPPDHPVDPGVTPVKVYTYHAEGSTLTLGFSGGVCSDYRATAVESAAQVRVTVTSRWKDGGRAICNAVLRNFTLKVVLAQPLGSRTVVNASDGQPVKGQ